LSAQAARLPEAIALGTLHPDDPDLEDIAREATGDLGLRGFKFYHSVQRFHIDDERLLGVYERAEEAGHVFVLHVGTMPYRDPFTGFERFARLMARFPRLRVCVAHMGAFQSPEFLALLPAAGVPSPLRRHHDGHDVPRHAVHGGRPRRRVRCGPRPAPGPGALRLGLPADSRRLRRGTPLSLGARARDVVRRKIFHDNALRFLR
jgi:Amidohydrolase